MTLAEKIKQLRLQEGHARGLNRPLTQSEVSRLIKKETGRGITQAYLSQLESGKRRHLTAGSREQLAAFFKVHPGYLVDDVAPARKRSFNAGISKWLSESADSLRQIDPALAGLLDDLSGEKNPRVYFDLLAAVRRDKDGLRKLIKEHHIVK
jgi:transcriptional regulator with XRE-family HTH domain